MSKNIRLPSGEVIELRPLTGKDWKDCLYAARKLSVDKGIDMAEVGYWEKYAELTTGYTMHKLESMSLEDYQYLIRRLMQQSKAGPKGPQETDETLKK